MFPVFVGDRGGRLEGGADRARPLGEKKIVRPLERCILPKGEPERESCVGKGKDMPAASAKNGSSGVTPLPNSQKPHPRGVFKDRDNGEVFENA